MLRKHRPLKCCQDCHRGGGNEEGSHARTVSASVSFVAQGGVTISFSVQWLLTIPRTAWAHRLPRAAFPHTLSSVFISLGSLFSNFPGLLTIPQSPHFLFLGLRSSHLVSRVQIKCIQLPHPAAPMRLSSHASSFISLLIRTSHFIFSVPHCWPSVCTTITQLGVFIPNRIWLIQSFIHRLQQLFPGSFTPGTLLEDGSVMRGAKQRWYLFPDTIFR